MTYQYIQTELDNNGIELITLSRPDKLNTLNHLLLAELFQAFEHVQQSSSVKGVVLTGAGNKAFCAGADIQALAELNAKTGTEFAKFGQAVFRALETLGKPSIAAINGYAFGGGCELAMSATLRIASTNAQFGQPEVKLGVIPGYGGTQRLARLVGKGRALDLCLTGRFIKAEEALSWGLVSELCHPEQLIDRAKTILNGVLHMSPAAVRSVLEVIDRGYDLTLDEALNLEALYFGLCCATEDKAEGVHAFLEKREAKFKDK